MLQKTASTPRRTAKQLTPITISVIVPVYNNAAQLDECLNGIAASDYPHVECIVVDDSSTDASADVAARYPVRLLSLRGGPSGPAHARNCGTEAATGDIVFFIDADVLIEPDTIAKVAATFAKDPSIDAVFGSYDEQPDGPFISQFKNLFHHFVHQQGNEVAGTFWSGCGAIRRTAFLEVGGFDAARYPSPSIEDIELGYRLRRAGYTIRLNKSIHVKHLKQWTLLSLIKADLFARGIPWTQLILEHRGLPNDLNLNQAQRVCGMLLGVTVLYLVGLTAFEPALTLIPLLALIYLDVVGHFEYPAERRAPNQRRHPSPASYVLLGSVIAFLLYRQQIIPSIFLIPACIAVAGTDKLWSFAAHARWQDALFTMAVAGTFAAIVGIFAQVSIVWLLPVAIALLTIIVINHQLYGFYVRARGLVFAIAAIPFHLFYYIYSLLSLVLGAGFYVYQLKATGGGHITTSRLSR